VTLLLFLSFVIMTSLSTSNINVRCINGPAFLYNLLVNMNY